MSDWQVIFRIIMRWGLVILSFSAVVFMAYYFVKAVWAQRKKRR
jgi:hypothetical protein